MKDKKKFKIAIVMEYMGIGGNVISTLGYAKYLAKLEYDVSIIVIHGKDIKTNLNELNHINVIPFTEPITLKVLSETMDTYDTVIISNGAHFLFGLEASRFTHKPLIVELLHARAKARQSPSVDMTIAVSEFIFNHMSPKENDIFIPNGVDFQLFKPVQRTKKEKVTLIQIAKSFKKFYPDLPLVATELIEEGLPIEAYIVGREGLSTNSIKYFGEQPYKNIPNLLQDSDILLHMPSYEGFGMVAIEAMAVGTIPIVSNVDGLISTVDPDKTGYIIPLGDIEKVKEIIRELVCKILNNHPDIDAMRKNAIERVNEYFDLSKKVKEAGKLIEEKSKTIVRKNRSSSYPFSFIALFPYFIGEFLGENDYFKGIEEIFYANNLEETLLDWKAFLNNIGGQWSNIPEQYFIFLDNVYTRIVYDKNNHYAKRKNVYCFWLALLAFLHKKYDKMLKYLKMETDSQGINCKNIPISVLKKICFCIMCYCDIFQNIINQDIPEDFIKKIEDIRNNYFLDNFDAIDNLDINMSNVNNIFQLIGCSELLTIIET